jgi:F420-dependent oxidoreductase-like protein
MRIGVLFMPVEHGPLDDMITRVATAADGGFHSVWFPQSRTFDALTALAVIGREVDRIELGTAVVPTYPRHPIALAAQAVTANTAVGGRLILGIGVSHKAQLQSRYGFSFDRPARHMREYLSVLLPLMTTGHSDFSGETLVGRAELSVPGGLPPAVLLAAMQPAMLGLAGSLADGTITWCTGPTILERQIVPLITKAAADAGRTPPRVVVGAACCVTNDEADGRQKADALLDGHGDMPIYRRLLDFEGVTSPGDISVVGDEQSVTAQLRQLEDIGVTDFAAVFCGSPKDRSRTMEHLGRLVSAG